jgi:hypothetical protein
MFIVVSLVHLAWNLFEVTALENDEYGFLDLYKPEVDIDIDFTENPSFLGTECGPASYVALKKVHEHFKGQGDYGENLKLLTYRNITMTEWDKEKAGRRPSKYIECGDEWKTSRCFKRLQEENHSPRLIIGSHKDQSTQTTATHSYINQVMYVYTTLPLDESVPIGEQKETKGWNNTIRLITVDHEILKSFLGHFNWKKDLTLITEVFQAHYMAEALFKSYELGHAEFVKAQCYPFTFWEQMDGMINEDTFFYPENMKNHREISDTYFRGDGIKSRSRSK